MSKLKRIRLSTHSKQRYSERLSDVDVGRRKDDASWAFKKGVSFENLMYYEKKNHKVYNALSANTPGGGARSRRVIKKYYKSSIYIFDRVSKRLITVYKLQDESLVEELEAIYLRLEKQRLPHVRGIVKK